ILTVPAEAGAVSARLPYVIGVLADLSEQAGPPLRPLKERRFVLLDRQRFDAVFRDAAPRLVLQVPSLLSGEHGSAQVELRFHGFPPERQLDPGGAEVNIRHWLALFDESLSAQVTAVLHHPDFRRLEATWRGLHYLVWHTDTGDDLVLRVLNVGKKELLRDLEK